MSGDATAYLARQMLSSRDDILLRARDAGATSAARAYLAGSHGTGGCGICPDGVWRRWDVRNHQVRLTVGTAAPVEMQLRDVVAWALARITPEAWAELERLRHARTAELAVECGDRDLSHRLTYRPRDVTAAERARVAGAQSRRFDLEQQARLIVERCLASDELAGQLELFELGGAA
jgi:hypothetical protein